MMSIMNDFYGLIDIKCNLCYIWGMINERINLNLVDIGPSDVPHLGPQTEEKIDSPLLTKLMRSPNYHKFRRVVNAIMLVSMVASGALYLLTPQLAEAAGLDTDGLAPEDLDLDNGDTGNHAASGPQKAVEKPQHDDPPPKYWGPPTNISSAAGTRGIPENPSSRRPSPQAYIKEDTGPIAPPSADDDEEQRELETPIAGPEAETDPTVVRHYVNLDPFEGDNPNRYILDYNEERIQFDRAFANLESGATIIIILPKGFDPDSFTKVGLPTPYLMPSAASEFENKDIKDITVIVKTLDPDPKKPDYPFYFFGPGFKDSSVIEELINVTPYGGIESEQ